MRRRRAERRALEPDPVYNSEEITHFINKLMLNGKKALARSIFYNALTAFAKKVNIESPREAFEKALDNAKPLLQVKSRRIGGATYQVPVEIAPERRSSLAMRWIIVHARKKTGRCMERSLAEELADCYNNQGATIKKKDDTHRMAEANRAFAHYKW